MSHTGTASVTDARPAGSVSAEDTPQRKANSNGDARGQSVILTVIEVLRCFTVEQPLQGVTEVGLRKSSVSRLLATREQEDIVERDETSRKFRLGLGLISVAGPLLANLDVRRAPGIGVRVLTPSSPLSP